MMPTLRHLFSPFSIYYINFLTNVQIYNIIHIFDKNKSNKEYHLK